MKRLLALFISISLFACKEEPKDYVTISGKIENPHESKTLKIFQGKNFERIINLKDDGTFKDTLKVIEGDYTMQHGNKYGEIYLKNNNESTINTNYNEFDKSMVFGGDAADINNFSVQSYLTSGKHFDEDFIATVASKEQLDNAINNYKADYVKLKEKFKGVDSAHVAKMDKNIERTTSQIQRYLASKIALRAAFPKGTDSPTFVDYENIKGGNTSLKDLKGKYIYIDVWATWCGPCKAEIPFLKKIEKQFHDKNIEFVSISVDEGRGYKGDAKKAHEGWKKMVADKQLVGIQLIADNGFKSQFIKDYKINGIPRFILIDPEGKIVNADAPRPSNPRLVDLFNSLSI